MNLDTIVQAVMVAVLLGIGSAVWASSIAIAKLGASFDAHTKSDEEHFDRLHADIRDASEIARAALYRRDE